MRPRKSPEETLADLQTKRDQITARIQKKSAEIRGKTRREQTRRKIIAGALALEHMAHDKEFANMLKRLLNEHVTRPEDRKLFDL